MLQILKAQPLLGSIVMGLLQHGLTENHILMVADILVYWIEPTLQKTWPEDDKDHRHDDDNDNDRLSYKNDSNQ
jgi:hypothetical protein